MVPAQPALEEPELLSWMKGYGSRGVLILHRMSQKAPVANRPRLLEPRMKGTPSGRNSMSKATDGPPAPIHGVTDRECGHLTRVHIGTLLSCIGGGERR